MAHFHANPTDFYHPETMHMTAERSHTFRIMVIDDHDLVRAGLSAYLAVYEDFLLVGEASTWHEAEALVTQQKPQVVLLDVSLGGVDISDMIRKLRTLLSDVMIIGLISLGDIETSKQAIQAGADVCLRKDVSAAQLAHTIRSSFG